MKHHAEGNDENPGPGANDASDAYIRISIPYDDGSVEIDMQQSKFNI